MVASELIFCHVDLEVGEHKGAASLPERLGELPLSISGGDAAMLLDFKFIWKLSVPNKFRHKPLLRMLGKLFPNYKKGRLDPMFEL